MISYHPDSRFLTDFAAANLPLSEAVCVSAHLEFCGKCRAHVQQLADIGGHMLARLQPQGVETSSFDRLMFRIGNGDGVQQAAADATLPTSLVALEAEEPSRSSTAGVSLPRALRRVAAGGLDNMSWVQFGKALRVAPVRISGDARETAIYDIKAGGRMPEHEHRGEEITVLLKGRFSDAEGSYSQGDFVVRNAGEAHHPMATQDTDCICLVSLERPVRPLSWFYRLLEPYVQYRLQKTLQRNTGF